MRTFKIRKEMRAEVFSSALCFLGRVAYILGVKLSAHIRAGLPGKENIVTGSAFFPAPAYRQEGRPSSRLARDVFSPTPARSSEQEVNEDGVAC
jgi:hypothetical protein